jgi:CMP-N-acetylneuraminic acid synthetase
MQTLEQLWIQDASLEICKVRTILGLNSLSGKKVIPFHMPDFEGFDINYPIDLEFLNYLIEKKLAALPSLDIFE